jgi:hypothetical protein
MHLAIGSDQAVRIADDLRVVDYATAIPLQQSREHLLVYQAHPAVANSLKINRVVGSVQVLVLKNQTSSASLNANALMHESKSETCDFFTALGHRGYNFK